MSSESGETGKAGVILAPEDANPMDKLSHNVLDDLLYNIVHDLLVKVHRDEKMARANTAAIKAEKLAMNTIDGTTIDPKPDVEIETEAAIYKEGKVTLKGNPLKTTKEILCPRCHLPRLLHPTDGKGAQKPDPGVIYCKKHPYIDKPGYDIYGQTWVAPGPGRGKKKKDQKLDPNDPNSPVPGEGSAKDRPPNVLSFPSATCSKCKRCILVTRLNNHMGSCIGNSGRNASRAAAQKISNGARGDSQAHDNTPPGSQKGTPLPASRAQSPRKRSGDEFDEDADDADFTTTNNNNNNNATTTNNSSSAANPKKKKLKPNALTKVVLKAKSPATPGSAGGPNKKDKTKPQSSLNVEQKAGGDNDNNNNNNNNNNDNDADAAKESTVQVVPPKKAAPQNNNNNNTTNTTKASGSPAKKIKLNAAKPPLPSPAAAAVAAAGGKKGKRERDRESESSGTLSSPPPR